MSALAVAGLMCFASAQRAPAGKSIVPKPTPKPHKSTTYKKVKKDTGEFKTRVVSAIPASGKVKKHTVTCTYSTAVESVATTAPYEDPVTHVVTNVTTTTYVTHYFKTCTNIKTGKKTTKEYKPGDGTTTGTEHDVVVPPVQIQKSGSFYTQRVGFFWVPAAYYSGIQAAITVDGKPAAGSAIARVKEVRLYPGYGPTTKAIDCTAGALIPFDAAKQTAEGSDCAMVYFQPSRLQPDGVYQVSMEITWTVDVNIPDVANEVIELQSDGQLDLEVLELQSVVVCQSNDPKDCKG
jgi:hypothetical protein